MRRSGIDVVGEVPWGTHFCQFYETSRDLVEILVPYFKEGLEGNEFCMWVTADPLRVDQAAAALRQAVPDLDARIAQGQIEILDYCDWYTRSGKFCADEVLQGWVDRLAAATARGFEGLRLTGNTFWLEEADWGDFTRYEEAVNNVIGAYRMLAICTYCLPRCGAREIMEVVANHQFALVKRAGAWEMIESSRHRKTEQALLESEERLRLATDAANLGVFDWEVPTGHAVWENQRMYEIFGRTPEDGPLSKAEFMERVIHPADVGPFEAALETSMSTGEPFRAVCRILRKDGEQRWVHLSARYVPPGLGRRPRLTGVLADITDRRAIEEALKKANQLLQKQAEDLGTANEELEAQAEERRAANEALSRHGDELREADQRKNEFLAMLAHELRNPMAAVSNALQLMARQGLDQAPALRHAHEVATRQAGHVARLLDDLLDVSRVTCGKLALEKEYVELGRVLASAVEGADPAITSRGHRVSVTQPTGPLLVYGDPVRLSQIITNLLDNAAKYTPPGGRIGVTVERDGDQARVRVRDTGIGIPTELLPRVFDLFVQADASRERAYGGLGIGLTMVRALVTMHGGRVQAYSAGPGTGTEVTVWLPLADTPQAPVTRHQSEPGTTAAPCRVLVVDDNADAAEMLVALLEIEGHEAAAARSGQEAVGLAPQFRPDLVLLDIGMPTMDGYEVARRLREDPGLAGVKIVAMTGYGQEDDVARSRAAGLDSHLVKPVDLEALRRVLDEARPRG